MIPAHQAQPIRAQEADESDKADESDEAENAEDQLLSELSHSKENQTLPTPEATPEPEQSNQRSGGDQDQDDQSDQEAIVDYSMPRGWKAVDQGEDAPDRVINNAPRREEISGQLDENNIIRGSRTRRLPGAYATSFMSLIRPTATSSATKALEGFTDASVLSEVPASSKARVK
ncbi:hypothetical protein EJ07DRAFT_156037 [Lizonia empirigonia]|nr:hypothetical protein EJ07DRAFT_156037 [Lizonia empirigonia]